MWKCTTKVFLKVTIIGILFKLKFTVSIKKYKNLLWVYYYLGNQLYKLWEI